ncbi:MAG: hypothetical protein J2O38_03840 [Acidimicrobiales bacterium]|nr:hypothetical protein [Acidimicrobiales bacterium]
MTEITPAGDGAEITPAENGGVNLEMVTASLRADASDTDTFFSVLGAKLSSALGERVALKRGGGLLRRSDKVEEVSVALGDQTFAARRDKGALVCQVRHAVRGVVLRTEELSFDAWLVALARQLAVEAKRSEATRVALESLLT